MRLQILENGHRPLQRAIMGFVRKMTQEPVPGPILVMSYRRDLFGKHLAACLRESMRLGSEWTLGETELFAAFVSSVNRCQY